MSNFNLESNNDKSNEVSLFRSLVSRSDLIVSGYNLETTNAMYCLFVSDLFLKDFDINLKNHKECIKNAKDLNIQISEKKLIDLRSLLSYTNCTNYTNIAFQNLESLFNQNISKSSFIIEFKNRYLAILNNISSELYISFICSTSNSSFDNVFKFNDSSIALCKNLSSSDAILVFSFDVSSDFSSV
jgi:hypothetical protein